MTTMTVLEAIRAALEAEMRADPNVIVLGEDVGYAGGVFRATEGLQREFGDDRVIDAPLAEAAIAGVAIGAALHGLRPVAEIQFADFIYPAMEQIIDEAAKIRYRSNGGFGVPLVLRVPYGAGVHGGLYHSQCVESYFFHTPGLKLIAPSTPDDYAGLLKAAIRDDDPVLFFEHKRAYRRVKGEVTLDQPPIPIGQARLQRTGGDLSVITYGLMVQVALEVADRLAPEGIAIEVLDLRTLLPLDRDSIARTAAKTGKVVVFHEDTKTGGIGAEIAAFLTEEHFDQLDGPILRVAAPDTPVPYSPPLEHAFVPGADQLESAVRRLAAY